MKTSLRTLLEDREYLKRTVGDTPDGIKRIGYLEEAIVNHPTTQAADSMLTLLKDVERQLTKDPKYNAWDLGPLKPLPQIREMIKKVEGT
jgi:hypothetical protein